MAKTIQSIEPNVANLTNAELSSYGLNYKLEQESLNTEIDTALNNYLSKNGEAYSARQKPELLSRPH